MIRHRANQTRTAIDRSIGRNFPPHGASETQLINIRSLLLGNVWSVIGDHVAIGLVERPARSDVFIVVDFSKGGVACESFVVPNGIFPASIRRIVEFLAGSRGVCECASVQRHSQRELVRIPMSGIQIVVHGILGTEVGTFGVILTLVNIRLMAREVGKVTALVVVTHEMDKVNIGSKTGHVKVGKVIRPGGDGEGKEEVGSAVEAFGIVVEFHSEFLASVYEVLRLFGGVRVLPIDIQTIEAQIFQQLDAGFGKILAAGFVV